MKQDDLPQEFKFKAVKKLEVNLQFILFLISKGFKVVGNKEEFLSIYVLSNKTYGYSIEEETIKVFLKDFNEDDFNSFDIPEINVNEYCSGNELSNDNLEFINNRDLINDTIEILSKVDPSKLNLSNISEIISFRNLAKNMESYS